MEERNCAFQYYDGKKVLIDVTEKTLSECKELFNDHYEDMIMSQNEFGGIEVAIWINGDGINHYKETHTHISNPQIVNNRMCELKYFSKFRKQKVKQ